jgi:N-acetylglucosaminyldiphosphoundecaprenol N-acetyl-beta-D-mannosaminyltransferase
MSAKIGKLHIDTFTKKEVLSRIENVIEKKNILQIVTPYSEFVVEAEYNVKFRNAINTSELRLADGIGILWAGAYLAHKWDNIWSSLYAIANQDSKLYSIFPEKISGSDLIYDILELASIAGSRIYLLGATEEVSVAVQHYINQEYPRITIAGRNTKKVELQDNELYQEILDTHSDIVLIALSYPKQEIIGSQLKQYFIKHKHKGVIACIGGSLDFIAGTQKRAPKWMQNLGLEWLYRLIQQPSRIRRIYKATIQFVILISGYYRNIDKKHHHKV